MSDAIDKDKLAPSLTAGASEGVSSTAPTAEPDDGEGKKGKAAKPRREAATQDRPRDAQGRELDAHGLPLIGPVRVAILAQLGLPDPDIEPEAWRDAKPSADDIAKASEAATEELTNG